ncbi:MAG TPA: ThuA domain-containing protein [Phycisphaerae bacterium]|nr:ThuA domain-containing protein [Phycisphaerae bacterium]
MEKIRTLLLTGANNHDWSRSSPFVKELLERCGRFEVTLTEDPSTVLGDAKALKDYSLLFSDYNGPEWSGAAKANFEAAVAGGTGLVILHAADNAFPGWVEYEKMIGLLWRKGTGHGQFHEFEVKIVDREHPITRGLAAFRLWDELYHRLVHMHGVDCHVLATAYSNPETGGTGNSEPVMIVTQYGKGRVYHHVLGHVWPGDPAGGNRGATMITFENQAFQRSLLRGCEWAATGRVTLP